MILIHIKNRWIDGSYTAIDEDNQLSTREIICTISIQTLWLLTNLRLVLIDFERHFQLRYLKIMIVWHDIDADTFQGGSARPRFRRRKKLSSQSDMDNLESRLLGLDCCCDLSCPSPCRSMAQPRSSYDPHFQGIKIRFKNLNYPTRFERNSNSPNIKKL